MDLIFNELGDLRLSLSKAHGESTGKHVWRSSIGNHRYENLFIHKSKEEIIQISSIIIDDLIKKYDINIYNIIFWLLKNHIKIDINQIRFSEEINDIQNLHSYRDEIWAEYILALVILQNNNIELHNKLSLINLPNVDAFDNVWENYTLQISLFLNNIFEIYIALSELNGKIHIISFSYDESYHCIDEYNNKHRILYIDPFITELQSAIEEFEYLLNNSKAKESEFQVFFEKYPQFILNEDYKKAHSHIILETPNEKRLIPDFMLEPFEQDSFCDILEIKRPSTPIFVMKKNRFRFSSAILESRAQLLEYSRYFDEKYNRDKIANKYGIHCYKPRLFIIIGRLEKISSFDRRIIEHNQPDIKILSYDDLIQRTKRKYNIIE